ncbi:GNAT family N-acetyltransferase [Marinovum sp.]|uniref:GNAT family N-acetyltransferase n=1 Tax=Marinovum sp. TaxID=2024839 RepID=UPI003A8D31EC
MTEGTFDFAPVLTGARLVLRPLVAEDRAALYRAASDPLIWAGHPTRTRHEKAVFDPYFDFLIRSGGTLAVTLRDSSEIIGASRFYEVAERPGTMAIGFTFLTRAHWGGAMNREMKALMCAHVFRWYDAVWLDIGRDNLRSQRAADKIGARRMSEARLTIGAATSDCVCYRIDRADRPA